MRTRTTIDPVIGFVLAIGLVLAIAPAVAAGPSHAWTRQFGTAGKDHASACAVDAARNIYVVGYVEGALPGRTSRGGVDAFLRKYRPDGRVAWTRQFGTAKYDTAVAIAIDTAGRVYVAGSTSGAFPGRTSKGDGDAFLRKYRPDGRVAWTRQFGTAKYDAAAAIAIDPAGWVYVAGGTRGTLPGRTSKGGGDAFLRKYRTNGRVVWTRQFGTASDDFARALTINAAGRPYVAGGTDGAFPGRTSKGGGDAFLRKHRPDGRVVWTRQFGTAGFDLATAVAINSAGKPYVVGETSGAFPGLNTWGARDAFLRSLRTNGRGLWTRQFGTADDDFATTLAIDAADRLYIGGGTKWAYPKGDGFVHKHRPDGNLAWTRRIGRKAALDLVTGVSVDRRGNVYVVGDTGGTLSGQQSQGGNDAFIRKYRR